MHQRSLIDCNIEGPYVHLSLRGRDQVYLVAERDVLLDKGGQAYVEEGASLPGSAIYMLYLAASMRTVIALQIDVAPCWHDKRTQTSEASSTKIRPQKKNNLHHYSHIKLIRCPILLHHAKLRENKTRQETNKQCPHSASCTAAQEHSEMPHTTRPQQQLPGRRQARQTEPSNSKRDQASPEQKL